MIFNNHILNQDNYIYLISYSPKRRHKNRIQQLKPKNTKSTKTIRDNEANKTPKISNPPHFKRKKYIINSPHGNRKNRISNASDIQQFFKRKF